MGGSKSKQDNADTISVNTQNNVSISDQIKNHYELFSLAGIGILLVLMFFLYFHYHRHRRRKSVHLDFAI